MLALRPLFKNQVRSMAAFAGPPSNPLSTSDKILHGFLMTFVFLSVPMFVTYKIPAWKKELMLSVRPLTKLVPHVRNMSVIAGPPSIHISGIEKFCHGVVIIGSCLVVPGYVLCNIRKYRGVE